jgi:putative OPT family oligopeptide transporter
MTDRPFVPYVPAEKSLPEFTAQAVVLGLLLSLVMCAANICVGLKAGMTVSAAIPASVISMGILRGLLKRGTILENNIVHTIASSGESLAAGIIFTVPALVMAGIWEDFNFWETTLIAMSGGVMGVVMMIPLRQAMIIDQKELRYPEGVACAEVLKAGDKGGAEMLGIFSALGIGALFKVCVSVLGVFSETVEWAWRTGRTALYVGSDVSPMLMAVGFIVGWEISLLVFLGGAVSFFAAIPILGSAFEFGTLSPLDGVWQIWDTQIRFFGIGAMIVAGVFSIFKVMGSIAAGVSTAVKGLKGMEEGSTLPRTDRAIKGKTLFGLLFLCLCLSTYVYYIMIGNALHAGLITGIMFLLAFFFVAVASYIVGLVGSSNSPVSGMTICAVLVTAALLLLFGYSGKAGILATIGVAGVVCCAACTSGDICQDLKIGHIIGATPSRLQRGELLGTMIPAFIIAPTLMLLHKAYGIGTAAREGVDALPAPQAAMFEKLVGGLFGEGKEIPWDLVGWGAAVGVVAIICDLVFLQPRNTKFRLHAMPLAVGMYLPLTVTFPILLGGAVFLFVSRRSRARGDNEDQNQKVVHRGLLFASGLVAGEAIMMIVIAVLLIANFKIPFLQNAAWAADINESIGGKDGLPLSLLSVAGVLFMCWLIGRRALGKKA